jgi:hypothetical protein
MSMSLVEHNILNEILNYKIEEIDKDTKFWMVRTKKGYFYDEFITKGYVAIAWNIITKDTVVSEQTRGLLANKIITEYPEIKRPTTVINKCISFIEHIKENDIIIIPNAGSHYITFARAGAYYEEDDISVEMEKTVIQKIENNDALINEVACPYKKRRKIHIIMTVSSENINPSLYRAITNHHGISNLTPYAKNILSTIYNAYSYNNDLNIIFNVRKDDPISPRLLSGILYGVTEYFEKLEIEDSKVSAQININSPGAIIFNIADCFDSIKDMCPYLIGLLIVVGGGSAVSFKVPGAVDLAKKILLLPEKQKPKPREWN